MNRTDELTARLLDGTLSDAEWVELERLLAADPTTIADHLVLLELEAVLRGLRADLDLTDATLEKVRQAQAERTTAGVMARIATQPQPTWTPQAGRRRARRLLFAGVAIAAVAAALLIGVWLGSRPHSDDTTPEPNPTASYAKITNVLGPVELLNQTGEPVPAQPGQAVAPGHTLRTLGDDSLAVVEFPDNTTVELDAGTVVRFADGDPAAGISQRVFLTQGHLTAAVPDGPAESRPMVVNTASAEVFTRGGRFVVTAAGPDSARVEPKLGKVQVARPNATKSVTVGVGGAAVILPGFDLVAVETALRVNRTPRWTSPQESHPGMRDVAFSPDGQEVWTASAKAFVRWAPGGRLTGPPAFYPRRGNEGLVSQFSRDRTALVVQRAEKDDTLVVRNLPGGERRVSIPTRVAEFRSLAVAPGAAWVASIDPRPNNRTVRLWDGQTGSERFVWETEESANCVAASHDGTALAVGVADPGRGPHNKIVFYDPATGLRLFALPTQRRAVVALAFSPDGRYLAAGFNGVVQVWDVRSRELVRTISGFERAVQCLAFSPDGEKVAVATPDGQVWVWNSLSGRLAQRIEVGSRGLRAIAFSPDGRSLVTAPNNAPVAVWELTDPEP